MSEPLNVEELVGNAMRPFFVRLLNAVHVANRHPETTNSCFLCASQKPPFDEALIRAMQPVQATIDALQAENARLREQADALADALESVLAWAWTPSRVGQGETAEARAALRTYREAVRHESEDKG